MTAHGVSAHRRRERLIESRARSEKPPYGSVRLLVQCRTMGSQLSLTCSRCGHTSKFSGNLAQDSFVCTSCGLQIHGVQIEQFDGCVYVLSNPSMPGLLKSGMTEQDAFSRARELSSATGVPEPYVVEAYVTCRDAASIELDVHRKLAHLRKPNREFFSVSIDEAVRLLEELAGKRSDYQRQERNGWVPPRGPVQFKIACFHCGHADWFVRGGKPSTCSACGRHYNSDPL